MTQRDQSFITAARQYNRMVWEGINGLLALQREWNAGDYGNTLEEGTESNEGIVRAEVGAVVFDTATALVTVLNAGSATNMTRLL